jgi:carboxylesterase
VDRSSEPFLLPGDPGRSGALLVHGFTGTPREMRFLGEAIQRAGRSALGVELAGHGAGGEAVDDFGWQDWLGSCEAGLEQLRRETASPRVHLVGFSLGGALSLLLARRHPEQVASLTLIATPLWLPFYFRWPVALRQRFGWLRSRVRSVRKLARGDLRDPIERSAHVATPSIPLAATASLLALLEEVRPRLESVRTPALVVHSRRDHAVPFACSLELVRRLPDAVHLPLDRSFHIVPLDVERERVAERMIRFQSETEERVDAEIRSID